MSASSLTLWLLGEEVHVSHMAVDYVCTRQSSLPSYPVKQRIIVRTVLPVACGDIGRDVCVNVKDED